MRVKFERPAALGKPLISNSLHGWKILAIRRVGACASSYVLRISHILASGRLVGAGVHFLPVAKWLLYFALQPDRRTRNLLKTCHLLEPVHFPKNVEHPPLEVAMQRGRKAIDVANWT